MAELSGKASGRAMCAHITFHRTQTIFVRDPKLRIPLELSVV